MEKKNEQMSYADFLSHKQTRHKTESIAQSCKNKALFDGQQ